MADLRTNYQDDVLDASKNTARVYDLVDSNGTVVLAGVHLEDKTVYTTEGDDYGATDINTQNGKINELSNDLTANSNKFEASYQNGKYGFMINGTFYEIGGGSMPILNYASPLHIFDNPTPSQEGHGLTFTATKECYLCGTIYSYDANPYMAIVTINGTQVMRAVSSAAGRPTMSNIGNGLFKIKAGDVIVANGEQQALHVFDVV